MDGHIFTTHGWVPADQVRLVESVTHDDETIRMVRVDKFIGDEWVGNDINGSIKTGVEVGAQQGVLNG